MKELLANLKLVWKYSKDQKNKIIIYGLSHIFIIFLGIILPIISARIIIELTDSNFKQLVIMAIVLFLINNCYNFIYYIQRYATQQIYFNSFVNIQSLLGEEILKVDNMIMDKEGSGVFLQRISSDTLKISDMFNSLIFFLSRIIKSIGIFVAILIINKIVFGFVIFKTLIILLLERKRTIEYNQKDKLLRKMQEKNSSFIAEMIRGYKDVKMLNAEKSFLKKYRINVEETNKYRYKMFDIDRKWMLVRGIIVDTFQLLLIFLIVYLIYKGHIETASALILYNYSDKIGTISQDIGFLLEKIKDFNLSCSRVFAILEKGEFKKETFGGKHLNKIKGNFEFKNVNFSYNTKKELFKNLSFKINENETVAFVGESGAGKTTIFNLLCKMYDISSGEILIDGHNIDELDKDSIRGNITIISQNPYIFNLSIRDNLKIVKEDLTDEEMIKACRAACLEEFINTLPNKYDTIVGEGGVTLSGGQKQRLAIARALIQKTEIILFDEATSALDNITQERIQKAIDNMKNEYTILIIAHRLSTIINSDRILYLEDGEIKAEGTHEELLKKSKGYKKLYETEIKK